VAGRLPNRAVGALAAAVLICSGGAAFAQPTASGTEAPAIVDEHVVCDLIDSHATASGLPRDFLARLIWKESRFDPDAVSPAGAEGIAQFMPGTARLRGLADPFDVRQAIPASAAYLADLATRFGNLGLAAAAYNAGEARVTRWLESGGFLPLETEDYVLDILGEPADSFADRSYQATVRPLHATRQFGEACRDMRRIAVETVAMSTLTRKPWGIQVAGNFRRAVAVRQWQRIAGRFKPLLAYAEPVVSRVRSARGRRGIYAVRIGADSRAEADRLCTALRAAGGACIVLRNR
jgi:hypothetical protein